MLVSNNSITFAVSRVITLEHNNEELRNTNGCYLITQFSSNPTNRFILSELSFLAKVTKNSGITGCLQEKVASVTLLSFFCWVLRQRWTASPGTAKEKPPSTRKLIHNLNPNRSLDFGEIARLCHAACFSPSRRRSGLRRG